MSGIKLPLFEVNFTYSEKYWVNFIADGDCSISIILFNHFGFEEELINKDSILYDYK